MTSVKTNGRKALSVLLSLMMVLSTVAVAGTALAFSASAATSGEVFGYVTLDPVIYTHGTSTDNDKYSYMMKGSTIADGSYDGERETAASVSGKTIVSIDALESTDEGISINDGKLTGSLGSAYANVTDGTVTLRFNFSDGTYEYHKMPVKTNPVEMHIAYAMKHYAQSGAIWYGFPCGMYFLCEGSDGSAQNASNGSTSNGYGDLRYAYFNHRAMREGYNDNYYIKESSGGNQWGQNYTENVLSTDKTGGYFLLGATKKLNGSGSGSVSSQVATYYLDISTDNNYGIENNSQFYSITVFESSLPHGDSMDQAWSGLQNQSLSVNAPNGAYMNAGSVLSGVCSNTATRGTFTLTGEAAPGTIRGALTVTYKSGQKGENSTSYDGSYGVYTLTLNVAIICSDKTAQRNLYADYISRINAGTIRQECYTEASWNNFRNALLDVEEYTRDNTDTTHATDVTNALASAYAALAFSATDNHLLTLTSSTAATCTAASTEVYTCSACGYKYTSHDTPASEHNFTGDVKCNNNGTHSYLCVNGCGTYGGTVDCDYAVADANGISTYRCNICNYTYKSNNTYTYAFVSDGVELESGTYTVASSINPPQPTKDGYTFGGWKADDASTGSWVNNALLDPGTAIRTKYGNVTFNALWTVNYYTVQFINPDGSVLQSSSVAYGETPVYEGTTPTLASDGDYFYTFTGWNTEIAPVTDHVTYTATYTTQAVTKDIGYDNLYSFSGFTASSSFVNATADTTNRTVTVAAGKATDGAVTGYTMLVTAGKEYVVSCDVTATGTYAVKVRIFNGDGTEITSVSASDGADIRFTAPAQAAFITIQYEAGTAAATFANTIVTTAEKWDNVTHTPDVWSALQDGSAMPAPANANCSEADGYVFLGWYTSYNDVVACGANPKGSKVNANNATTANRTVWSAWKAPHSYTSVVTAPTCTAGGYTTYTCSACGDSYTADETAAKGHSWNDGEITTAAGCITAGVMTYTCTACGETKTETIEATGHKAGTPVREDVVEATCTANGSYNSVLYCSVCGTKMNSVKQVIKAKGHTAEIDEAVPATCHSKGLTAGSHCSVCGIVIEAQTEVDMLPHSYNSAVTTPAGCETEGVRTYTCANCTASYTEAIPATGHTSADDAGEAATCSKEGRTAGTYCSVCGKTLSGREVIAKLAHTPGAEVTENEVAPDCTNDGGYDKVRYCTICGEEATREHVTTTATGHTPGTAANCTEAQKCTVCGAVITPALGHDYGSATCDQAATCSRCGYTSGAAIGHNYVETVTAPTCTEDGYTTYTCSRCHNSYTDNTVPATGHSGGTANCVEKAVCEVCGTAYGAINPANHKTVVTDEAVPATCYSSGLTEGSHCSACGTVIKEQAEIAPVDHTFTNYTSNGDATCSADGTKTAKCLYCDVTDTLPDTGSKLAHTAGTAKQTNYVDSTCSLEGSYTELIECAICGETISSTVKTVAKKAHTPAAAVKENVDPASCTGTGSYDLVVRCANCNEIISSEKKTITGTGHVMAEAITENVTAATCSAAGSYDSVVYCANCNLEISRITIVTAPLDHTVVSAAEVAASCSATGTTAGEKCSVCGAVISGCNIIPKKAHTEKLVDRIEPTCTENGVAGKTICAVCGEVISEVATVIPATGHSFGAYTVTVEATAENRVGKKTATCSVCGATDEIDYYYEASANRGIKFVTIDKLSYTILYPTKNYTVYKTSTLVWDSNRDLGFKVNLGTSYESAEVYLDGAVITPDADGIYTIPQGKADAVITVNATEKIVDPEAPTEPTTPTEPASCTCLCHATSPIMQLIWKIVRLFYKLFRINKVCYCGAVHY